MILDRIISRFSGKKEEPDLEAEVLATGGGSESLFHETQTMDVVFYGSGIVSFNYEQKVRSRRIPYLVKRLGSGGEFLRFYLIMPSEYSVLETDEVTFLVDLREIHLKGFQTVDIFREIFWEPGNPKSNEVRTVGEIKCKLELDIVDKFYPWNRVVH